MPRFLVDVLDINTPTVKITDKKEIHHLKDVLRLKAGEGLTIFNGKGDQAAGEITDLKKDEVTIKILKRQTATLPPKLKVILACALPKKAKFESIIEKCTELGVDEIFPLITERTEVHLDEKKCQNKALRYRTVAVNAAKQSQRTTLPVIHPPVRFMDFIGQIKPGSKAMIPCLAEPRSKLQDVLRQIENAGEIISIIGPEGDFTPQELDWAKQKGCIPVSLGTNTLKVDTAAISVTAFIKLYADR